MKKNVSAYSAPALSEAEGSSAVKIWFFGTPAAQCIEI